MNKTKDDAIRLEREEAWVGDAVLALFAREWILDRHGRADAEMMIRLTSNQFLSAIGNPTSVEARIGRRYRKHGLEAAFAFIDAELVPLFEKREKKRARPGVARD